MGGLGTQGDALGLVVSPLWGWEELTGIGAPKKDWESAYEAIWIEVK
ncbi:hypothetical protein GCM10023213_12620 [Prosthecobacter algae]|uniref:Uncharacterized protein n=1 Tax=Prosthecobacter algae TaxID=1144682 RepID=A0ABP9P4H7_9BACT